MIEKLNALINEEIAKKAMPGANYCLIAGGKKYFDSLGNKAEFPEIEANSINTIYDLASLTKVIATTTSIMMLLEQGKLKLYDSVKDFVPKFRYKHITVWDLITHTSGLPSDVPSVLYSSEEELRKYLLNADLKAEKNTKIIYSDISFMILGFVVESVSGMPLDEFTKKHIFEPLEMIDSGYKPQDVKRCAPTEDRGDFIDRGYVHDEKAHTLNDVAGHAGLFSTVHDVANFIEMILNDGVYKGKQILSKASIDLLYTPQVEEYNGISKVPYRRSIGWILKGPQPVCGELASNNTIMHTGFTGTHLFIDRDNKIGFCLLANRVHPTRENQLLIKSRPRIGNYIITNF